MSWLIYRVPQEDLLKYYKVCSNDNSWLISTIFTATSSQIWPLMILYGEKDKTMDFPEMIVVCNIKVGGCHMSRSFIDLGPRSLKCYITNFFSSETAKPIEI